VTINLDLPALGENITEAQITRRLKQIGDTVEADEPLLEVATDKVDTEIPAPIAGTLTAILADEDATVTVGAPIATIEPVTAAVSTPAEPTPATSAVPSAAETPLAAVSVGFVSYRGGAGATRAVLALAQVVSVEIANVNDYVGVATC
jgi:pyruvate dehydrogenase E2 component (dihydrolipoamide acetyltransferase)